MQKIHEVNSNGAMKMLQVCSGLKSFNIQTEWQVEKCYLLIVSISCVAPLDLISLFILLVWNMFNWFVEWSTRFQTIAVIVEQNKKPQTCWNYNEKWFSFCSISHSFAFICILNCKISKFISTQMHIQFYLNWTIWIFCS